MLKETMIFEVGPTGGVLRRSARVVMWRRSPAVSGWCPLPGSGDGLARWDLTVIRSTVTPVVASSR